MNEVKEEMYMNEVKEITLDFPYLYERSDGGILFSEDTLGKLDALINYSDYEILVTLYPSREEYKYATDSSLRYNTVDPMFKVGKVKSFSPENGKIVLEVSKDIDVADMRIYPRAIVSKIKGGEGEEVKSTLERLICIDIVRI